MNGCFRVWAKCLHFWIKLSLKNSFVHKCVRTSESALWPLPEKRYERKLRRVLRTIWAIFVNGAKHSPWISWNFSKRGRGQNVTSDVSTQLGIKSFLNANLGNKCDELGKSVIHASNHFHRKTLCSFEMLSKVSADVVTTAHFDL